MMVHECEIRRCAYDILPIPNELEIRKVVEAFLIVDITLLVSFFNHYTIVRDD